MLHINIAKQYPYQVIAIEPLGNGFINDTYLVRTQTNPFVLQKINHNVFPQPEQIMSNLEMLNQHVGHVKNAQSTLQIPQLLQTKSKHNFFRDGQGYYWRALSYIENTEGLETINDITQAEQVGSALAEFHRLTYQLNSTKLHDTLPGFHITPEYLAYYQRIKWQTANVSDDFCKDFIDEHHRITNDLEAAKKQGLLVIRTIHGDPKLNNFLFDRTSQKIVSIVDLDTVKPGLIHYDIGDCLRSCCHNTVTNTFDLEICQALLTRYLSGMGDYFSEDDYSFLYPAIRLIPFELGIRFYTDYLEGNRYFKVVDPEQNLRRAHGQFRLCESVLVQTAEIKDLISRAREIVRHSGIKS